MLIKPIMLDILVYFNKNKNNFELNTTKPRKVRNALEHVRHVSTGAREARRHVKNEST